MLVYRYDPETKIFLHSEPAMLDPLESEKQGRSIYLLPANCTFTEPPQERWGYNVVYNAAENKWQYEEQPVDPAPESAPEPTPEEKKAAEIAALDEKYKVEKQELLNYYLEAMATGNSDMAKEISEEIKALNEEYDQAREALYNG